MIKWGGDFVAAYKPLLDKKILILVWMRSQSILSSFPNQKKTMIRLETKKLLSMLKGNRIISKIRKMPGFTETKQCLCNVAMIRLFCFINKIR